jgi:hypothetical protein
VGAGSLWIRIPIGGVRNLSLLFSVSQEEVKLLKRDWKGIVPRPSSTRTFRKGTLKMRKLIIAAIAVVTFLGAAASIFAATTDSKTTTQPQPPLFRTKAANQGSLPCALTPRIPERDFGQIKILHILCV